MSVHKDLTETDLHELKGASTATSGQVPVSNGSGSTVFSKINKDSIDTNSIKNINVCSTSFLIDSTTGVFTKYLPITKDCTLVRVSATCSAAPSANTQLDVKTSGGSSMASLSILAADSIPTFYTTTTILNSAITAGSIIQINHPNVGTTVGPTVLIFEFALS